MKKKIIKDVCIIIFCGIFSLIFRHVAIYIIDKIEEKHWISYVKDMNYSGVIEYQIYNGEEEGYDYITTQTNFVLAKCFFSNNNLLNLQEGDSIHQIPNELVLEIFRKDENGQYKYIGTSK